MMKILIPITDDGTECNEGYIVEYKLTSDTDYTRVFPDQLGTPVEITGLLDDVSYDVRVTRKCCNGTLSDPTIDTVITTP
jgi:hypothetical protein